MTTSTLPKQKSLCALNDKTVLITGASSGIGRACVELMASLGARIVAVGRDERRLAESLAVLSEPSLHSSIAIDLAPNGAAQTVVKRLADTGVTIDGVVCAAGITYLRPLKLAEDSGIEHLLSVNLKSPIALVQSLLRAGRLNRGASAVLLSSIAAHTGTEGVCVYAASKGGLDAFVRPAALELARKKMRINTLVPGLVRSPIHVGVDDAWYAEHAKRYPLGLGEPIDVARAAAFLLSDAAAYITGTRIVLDGGCIHV